MDYRCIPPQLAPPHVLSISKKVPKYVPLNHPKYLLVTLVFSHFLTPASIASENIIDCTYQCWVPIFPPPVIFQLFLSIHHDKATSAISVTPKLHSQCLKT